MRAFVHQCFILCFCCLLLPSLVFAKTVPVKMTFGKTDDAIICALMISIPNGYHAYSHDTVDTGRPTELDMEIADTAVDTILYPKGAAQRDIFSPENSVFVYEGETYLFAKLPKTSLGKQYQAQLSLLLCSKRNCIPINQELHGVVPQKIRPLAWQKWYTNYKQQEIPKETKLAAIQNLPQQKNTAPLPPPEQFSTSLIPEYATNLLEITTLSKALLFGILAGLLLNIMPCVLPVLTFKMSGLLLIGSKKKEDRIRTFRLHNIFFSAGIISFFTLLAAFLGFADAIWGQLFQNETVILVMLVLVFAMGLSLLEVFTLPVIDLKINEKTKNPHLQAYLTGFLTTLLATPCSGPLLGGVLGWAFTQPFTILIVVFWFIGIGMAIPYIIFSMYPNAVLLLPKAGRWMNVVEHIAGFFLLGTALYLLSILPKEKYLPILSVLLLLSVAAWLWGQYCGQQAPKLRKRILGSIALVLLVISLHWVLKPLPKPLTWQNFTQQYFTTNLGQKILFVEFTADWCPNCKLMEKTVLTDATLKELLAKEDFELIRADLTQANAAATYLLTELGSHSIPLTAIFPKGSNANSPIVLRDIYTTELLRKSFDRALSKSNGSPPQDSTPKNPQKP